MTLSFNHCNENREDGLLHSDMLRIPGWVGGSVGRHCQGREVMGWGGGGGVLSQ